MPPSTPPGYLDFTGTQAAIYPSEEALWVQGPPINAPGNQGVAFVAAQQGQLVPPGPVLNVDAEEAWIHQQVNGETPNGAYEEVWVNVQQYGPTGLGPWTNQDEFQTGHSQNVVSNPAAEQGWGVGPARRWSHFPVEDSPNPFRNRMVHLRNGELPWVTSTSSLYERSQLAWEQQWDQYKRRSPVAPVVQVPVSVPFVQTVPTYSGGPSPHPGVDLPIGDEGIYG
jgi:hypothetical protein